MYAGGVELRAGQRELSLGNRRVIGKLVWKHAREMRALCLVLIVGTLVLQWLAVAIAGRDAAAIAALVAVLVGSCFAAATALLAFSGERDRGTDLRLLAMSAAPGDLLVAAIIASGSGFVAVTGVGLLHGIIVAGTDEVMASLRASMYFSLLPPFFLVGGLVCRTTVRAIGVAAVLLTAVALCFTPVLLDESLHTERMQTVVVPACVAGLCVGLLVACWWLAKCWCMSPCGWQWRPLAFSLPVRRRSVASGLFSSNLQTIARLRVPSICRNVLAIWRTELRARGGFLLLAMVVVGAGLVGDWLPNPVTTSTFLAAVCGVMSFESESAKERVRFYSERGVPRRSLWLGKQTLWFSIVTLIGAAAAVSYVMDVKYEFGASLGPLDVGATRRDWGWLALSFLTLLQTCFVTAQLGSLWLKQRLAAIGIGLLSWPLILSWPAVVLGVGIPAFVGLVPLLLAATLGSWFWFEPWMNRRLNGKARLPVCIAMCAGLVGCWALPTLTRIYRVPTVAEVPVAKAIPPELRERLLLPGAETPGFGSTRGRLEQDQVDARLAALGKLPVATDEDGTAKFSSASLDRAGDWKALTDVERAWYDRHAADIPEIVDLASFPGVASYMPARAKWLLQLDALRLASEGNIAAAIERTCLRIEPGIAWDGTACLQIARMCCAGNATLADVQIAKRKIREFVRRQWWSSDIGGLQTKSGIIDEVSRKPWDTKRHLSAWLGERAQFERAFEWRGAAVRRQANRFRELLCNQKPVLRFVGGVMPAANSYPASWRKGSILLQAAHDSRTYPLSADAMRADVNDIMRARMAMAVLDVVEHLLKHGRLPTELQQVDPWSGISMSLNPTGLSRDLRLLDWDFGPRTVLEAGTPFLWVRGERYMPPDGQVPGIPFYVLDSGQDQPLWMSVEVCPIPKALFELASEHPSGIDTTPPKAEE